MPLTDHQYILASPFFSGQDTEPEKSQEFFVQLFTKISKTLKRFLVAETTAMGIWEICRQYQLSDAQISLAAIAIRQFTVGELLLRDFISALTNRLSITGQVASNLTSDLLQKVLQPVIRDIQELQASPRVNPAASPPIRPAANLYANSPISSISQDIHTENVIDLRNRDV